MKLSTLRDEVSKFVTFFERNDANGEYVQGGVSNFIDTAATKTITMKLHKTQVDQELLRQSNWIQNIVTGLKEDYVSDLQPSVLLRSMISGKRGLLISRSLQQ